MPDLDTFFDAYVECAVWCGISNEEGTEELDLSSAEVADDAKASMRASCERFIAEAGDLLDGIEDSQAGHDFWLTRNHHGAGFWDRGYGEIGDKLTTLAHKYGEKNLYLGDDGDIHCE